jgi:hypothetical protein
MFAPEQYRTKASEYGVSLRTSSDPHERRVYQELRRNFAELANNEQSLSDNHQRTLSVPGKIRSNDRSLGQEEEHMLRCLGAALIMQWTALPTKLRRELFDNAGAMGELSDVPALRGQIARFLHRTTAGTKHRQLTEGCRAL